MPSSNARASSSLLKGAAVMTVFALCGKLLGVFLRLYLTARIGSEGIGLYQLVMSVYGLFSTVATAGLTVAVSRLAAEKAAHSLSNATLLLRASIVAGLAVSLLSTAVLLGTADFFAKHVVQDIRTASSLRILACSMPFMAIAACFKGWFIARRQVLRSSSASLFEQCVKFAVMALFLNGVMAHTNDLGLLCTGIVLGVTIGECSSFCYLWIAYRFLRGHVGWQDYHPTDRFGESLCALGKVAAPIGLSIIMTSLLHTAENLLLPSVFERYGGDRATALSQFGVIRGMVIPLLFFPFAFLQSLVSVMIPEISRLGVSDGIEARDRQIQRILTIAFLFGIAAGGLFFFLPQELGETFYPGQDVTHALRLLALVNPFMYVQTICDGLLKAVDGQKYTLRYSVYNSLLRLAVIFTLIPLSGAEGYLLLLMLSNTFEFALCYRRLKTYARFSVGMVRGVLAPLVSAVLGGFAARLVLRLPSFVGASPLPSAMAGSAVYLGVFLLLTLPLYKQFLPIAKRRERAAA